MSDALTENFCSHCGVSLVPLQVPHSSASCETCGKTKHFVRPGDGGKGIKIEAGETFTVPADWLRMSFNPALGNGRLARGGVPFLLKKLIVSGMPQNTAAFVTAMKSQCDAWGRELQKSDKLAGIDLSSPGGGDEAYERLKEDKDSWEWHLLMRHMMAIMAVEYVEAGDALSAAHCALYAGLFHALSVVTEPYLEETIWRGYVAGLAVHECSVAADHVPGEAEALAELDPLFRRIGEASLKTWVDSRLAIGPRISVTSIPEPVLVARAKWHLEEFKREREERQNAPAERRARWEF